MFPFECIFFFATSKLDDFAYGNISGTVSSQNCSVSTGAIVK